MNGYKRHAIYTEEIEKSGLPHLEVQRIDTSCQWSSAERAVNTCLRSFSAVISALDRCKTSKDMDSATVAAASSLKRRMEDFGFIVSLHVIKEILSVIGPISRQLQASTCDLALAAVMIKSTITTFLTMRQDDGHSWLKILATARTFATDHGLPSSVHSQRPRTKKMMAGEQAPDERIQGEEQLKVEVWYRALDDVIGQLNERFGRE